MANDSGTQTNRLELLVTTSGSQSVSSTYSVTSSIATETKYLDPYWDNYGYRITNLVPVGHSAVVTINGLSDTWTLPPNGFNAYYSLYQFILGSSTFTPLGITYSTYSGTSLTVNAGVDLNSFTIIVTQIITTTKIQPVQNSYYLDTYGDDSINFELLIQSINDLSSSNSSYSYNFKLPGTKNNRQSLGFIESLNSPSTKFNPNYSLPASILVDSIPVLEGNLYVTDIITDVNNNQIDYNCVIVTGLMNLISTIGDSYLTDLDWSQYSHIYSIGSVTQSWSNTWAQGYVYGFLDNGYNLTEADLAGTTTAYPNGIPLSTVTNGTSVQLWKPSTFAKVIWDKVITNAGYSYNSNFLNSPTFENIVIPYASITLQNSQAFLNQHQFEVGLTGSYTTGYNSVNISQRLAVGSNYNSYNGVVRFNNNYTYPFFDGGGNWNTTAWKFTNNSTDTFICSFTGHIEIIYYNPINKYISSGLTTDLIYQLLVDFQIMRQKPGSAAVPIPLNNGNTLIRIFSYPNGTAAVNQFWNPVLGPYSNTVEFDFQSVNLNGTGANSPITPGESVWVQMGYQALNWGDYGAQRGGANVLYYPIVATVSVTSNSYFFDTVQSVVAQNTSLNYNSVIPQNIKQKDFLLSIIKMFNLYIEPDKFNPYLLNIEPRDSYYSSGNIIDWTGKVNIDTPVDEQMLSVTQAKSTLLTYKLDGDYYNQIYNQEYNQVYGQYRYSIDSNFIQGENKNELIFSSTPLIALPVGSESQALVTSPLVVTKIESFQSGTIAPFAFNLRILYYKKINQSEITGIQQVYNMLKINGVDTNNLPIVQTFSFYPYMGNYDDPYSQTLDLNYGQPKGQFNNLTSVTNNNLYNLYWKNNLNEFSDPSSRLITVEAYLSPTDIANFRFNDNIYINLGEQGSQYYKVVKIYNYNPNKIVTCNIDLIKSYEIIVKPSEVVNLDPSLGQRNLHISGYLHTSTTNNVNNGHQIIIGPGNTTWRQYTSIVGTNNISGAERNFIFGHNNNINGYSDNNFIVGSQVQVMPNQPNNIVLGSTSPVRSSGQLLMATTPVLYINDLDAGVDQILNLFPTTTPINVINAGNNVIRNLGSNNLIQTYDGGVDFIL